MKNRFNKLTSKEWLPFQKSWFHYNGDENLYLENIRFFTKGENQNDSVYYSGENIELVKKICSDQNLKFIEDFSKNDFKLQFAFFDLRGSFSNQFNVKEYENIKSNLIKKAKVIFNKLEDRRFIAVFIPNIQKNDKYYPIAWDLSKSLSTIFSLKDEKIGCLSTKNNFSEHSDKFFAILDNTFYCLYFRKDENSPNSLINDLALNYIERSTPQVENIQFDRKLSSWYIIKPKPRKKNEILHPAKYPEELVDIFIQSFSKEGDNIFDPMSGTGSTQVSALKKNRNGYGTELSEFFYKIANDRCKEIKSPTQHSLFGEEKRNEYKILNKDVREITKNDFPKFDYLITSPPYWDMLNMKGAENQAKRIKNGLQTNYSKDKEDLGNIEEYRKFLDELVNIYFDLIKLMKKGSYITIIVKNIKKKGRNYQFAWDLANELQNRLILLPEIFWCQDDISIAPYGYGNTFVSNTFHQYCLNFQVPL